MSARGNLLGDTVDIAATEEDLTPLYANDFPVGENLPENCPGDLVLGRIKQGKYDAIVGNQEVRVGTRQALPG